MRFLILCIISITVLSCKKKEVEIPSYIHIEPFTFTATDAQGGKTANITNGQVFIGNTFVGDYEFPITIPVNVAGDTVVSIFPSVKENGISNGRKVYKLYEPHKEQVSLKRGLVDSVKPSSTYKQNVNFVWIEDFDDNAISMEKGLTNSLFDSLETYPFTATDAFKGSGKGFSGGVYFPVNSVGFIWEAITVQEFLVPKKGKDVYVELDLKSDIAINIGVIYNLNNVLTQRDVVTFFPTGDVYKKLYINLETEVSPLPDDLKVRLFFGGFNFTDSASTPKVFIDNLKLAYLQ
ncbi:hypothetical protein OAB01_00120 [Bacteroidia bacterium]|mgnify:CR=1 FL=1|nr:hypothetical protein [Bacteroidia bacterium]